MFVMTKKILECNKPKSFDLTSALCVGKRGIGKTIYCIKVARQYYEIKYGMETGEAYEHALNSIIFSLDEMIHLMKTHSWKNRVDLIIFDDCGIFTSGMMYSSFHKQFAMLRASLDGIRGITGALLMTAPAVNSVAKFIQSYEHYVIKVRKYHNWERIATGYQKYRAGFGKTYTRKIFQDNFSTYLKQPYFSDYMELRNSHKEELIKVLDKMNTKSSKQALKYMEGEV